MQKVAGSEKLTCREASAELGCAVSIAKVAPNMGSAVSTLVSGQATTTLLELSSSPRTVGILPGSLGGAQFTAKEEQTDVHDSCCVRR